MSAAGETAFQQEINAQSTPFGVRIAGLLCLAVGMTSIKTTLDHFLTGFFQIELGVIGLFLGKRLLEGSPSCRLWTIFLAGVSALLSTGFAVWLVYNDFQSAGQSKFPYAVAHHVVIAVSAIFVLGTLLRGDIRDWFLTPRVEPARGGSWAFPVSMILAILLTRQLISDQSDRQELLSLFHVSTTVMLKDAKTDEPLRSIHYESDALKRSRKTPLPWPRVSARLHSSQVGGIALELEGMATEPMEIILSSAGYESRTIHLTKSSPSHLTLELNRNP